MKNNKTLLPQLYYHTIPQLSSFNFTTRSALPIKPFQNFLKIRGVITPLARLSEIGKGVPLQAL